MEKNAKIVLENIFFDIGDATLKNESKKELNNLILLMSKNKSLKIEISGHTDNKGDKNLNQLLSEKRAQNVVNYLITNGISEHRLTAKGYGSLFPIASNEIEVGRQKNRRTEFKIIDF